MDKLGLCVESDVFFTFFLLFVTDVIYTIVVLGIYSFLTSSRYETETGIQDSFAFVYANFVEANRLWCRIQTQAGQQRDKSFFFVVTNIRSIGV